MDGVNVIVGVSVAVGVKVKVGVKVDVGVRVGVGVDVHVGVGVANSAIGCVQDMSASAQAPNALSRTARRRCFVRVRGCGALVMGRILSQRLPIQQ
jgi:hypothetical protein